MPQAQPANAEVVDLTSQNLHDIKVIIPSSPSVPDMDMEDPISSDPVANPVASSLDSSWEEYDGTDEAELPSQKRLGKRRARPASPILGDDISDVDTEPRAPVLKKFKAGVETSDDSTLKASINYADVVTLGTVQDDEVVEFVVHKDLVVHYSPRLRKFFEYRTGLVQEDKFIFTENRAAVVKMFVGWLYTQHLGTNVHHLGAQKAQNAKDQPDRRLLIEIWVLASELRIRSLQDLAMKLLKEAYNLHALGCQALSPFLSHDDIVYVYDNTFKHSLLRKLCAQIYVIGDHIDCLMPRMPQDFWQDAALIMAQELPAHVRRIIAQETMAPANTPADLE